MLTMESLIIALLIENGQTEQILKQMSIKIDKSVESLENNVFILLKRLYLRIKMVKNVSI